ncbi:uncharacterized protein EI90DRAFT_3079281 [Cantharellus anzutake]|uniref:uncharacterized protein n=1 Tax=Cantharellus anzutake TaxID=1750568 RepID=UPI001903A09D|nr:uncharacterized protein EI90DRAFT_3079281 [Cantharellus anzutake]KAF8321402.1 hypothetical protein EI90DRAFT_3079281 [Cantharellus anzutake]
MEAREELEDAQTEEEVESVVKRNKERIRTEAEALERYFAGEDYESALRSCVRLRYWQGIEEAAKERP